MCEESKDCNDYEEVWHGFDPDPVNKKLAAGWIVLDVFYRDADINPVYVLGKPRAEPVQKAPVRTGWGMSVSLTPSIMASLMEQIAVKPAPRACSKIPLSECNTFGDCATCLAYVEPEKLLVPLLNPSENKFLTSPNIQWINRGLSRLTPRPTTIDLLWSRPCLNNRLEEGWMVLCSINDNDQDDCFVLCRW